MNHVIKTFPDSEVLDRAASKTPMGMRPARVPYVILVEGFLSKLQCEQISRKMKDLEPYRFPQCGAVTREIPIELNAYLWSIEEVARYLNNVWFGFELDKETYSWLQLYVTDGNYKRHIDGSVGQGRKMTAVALLSDPEDYDGGHLCFDGQPGSFSVPRTQGTVAIFPPWLPHEVTEITRGERETINMGFFGPPFR